MAVDTGGRTSGSNREVAGLAVGATRALGLALTAAAARRRQMHNRRTA